MANEVTIKVKADADGLSGQIKAAVDVAAASPFNVKIAASVTGTAEAVSKALAEAKAEADRAGITFRASVALDRETATVAAKGFAENFTSTLSSAFGGGGGGGVLSAIGSFLTSPGGIAVAVPVIGGLVSSFQALVGILPIVGAGMVGLGLAAVTLKLGFTDVVQAIGEFNKQSDATMGKTAQLAAQHLSTSNSILSADLAVRHSRQALGDAYRNSANTMISAHESVGNAQQAQVNQIRNATAAVHSALNSQASAYRQLQNAEDAEARAQRGVIDAKEAASRAMEDSTNKVIDTEHAHEQAVLNLRDAQNALFAPHLATGPPPNIAQLSLAVREAQQRVIETQQAWDRAGADATKATDRGVDGSRQVISAQDALKSAINSVAAAHQSIGAANEQLTRTYIANDVAKGNADQRLGDALRALQQAQINGDEQIQRAKEGVNTALRAQQQTLAQAAASAESAAGSLAMYNAMLAKLAPNAADAVRAVTSLKDEWEAMTRGVQQNIFAGVGDEIRRIGDVVLPVVRAGLEKMADALGAVIRAFTTWLTSKDAVRDMGQIFGDVAAAVKNLAPAIQPMMQIITDLVTVAASFLPGMSSGFADSAKSAADFIRHARDSGKLKEWMQSGIDAIRALWSVAVDLVRILGDLSASKGPNAGFLSDLATVVRYLREAADAGNSVLQFLDRFGNNTSAVGGTLRHFLGGPAAGLLDLFRTLSNINLDRFAGIWDPLWQGFKWVINAIAKAWNSLHFGIPSMNLFGWRTPSFDVWVPQIPTWMATGGISGGGLTVVGEQGPELVNLGAGSQVSSAANTQTALSGQSTPQKVIVQFDFTGTDQAFLEFMRNAVRARGGNVQTVMGR